MEALDLVDFCKDYAARHGRTRGMWTAAARHFRVSRALIHQMRYRCRLAARESDFLKLLAAYDDDFASFRLYAGLVFRVPPDAIDRYLAALRAAGRLEISQPTKKIENP